MRSSGGRLPVPACRRQRQCARPVQSGLAVSARKRGAALTPHGPSYVSVRPARQGFTPAALSLGRMFANGDGVPRSPSDAAIWFRAAAERGDLRGPILARLRLRPRRGGVRKLPPWPTNGSKQPPTTATLWRKSISRRFFLQGAEVLRDPRQAARWYEAASIQGLPMAKLNSLISALLEKECNKTQKEPWRCSAKRRI